jgi:hypothetical protein
MRDAFGVERGEEIAKFGIPGAVTNFASRTMAKPMAQNAIKGAKAGFGGWKQPGLGRAGAVGAGAGKAGAFGLKYKKPIGIGAGATGGTALAGYGGYKMGQ